MERAKQTAVSRRLEDNQREMARLLPGDGTLICREFAPQTAGLLRCCLYCIDGMADADRINESLIRPVLRLTARPEGDAADWLARQVVQVCECKTSARMDELIRAVLSGDTAVFCDGCAQALIVGTRGYSVRAAQEPEGEKYLKGPREGFTESLRHNQAMLRRKLCTPALRMESLTLGTVSGTDCALCYLDDAVDRAALTALRERLAGVRIDGVPDVNTVAELVQDAPWASMRTTGSTERPDVAAAKLLEGRIVLLADGSPVALTVPHIFLEQLQSGEDYYVDYAFAGINRLLRVLGFLLSVSLMPLYIALVNWHRTLLPLPALLSIAAARRQITSSSVVEAFMLLLAFDTLREAGSRTPGSIGQTLSVVGGLVVGQAAVQAHLVSAPVLIVVALSGVTGLIVPKLKATVILWRTLLTLLAAQLGIYGLLLGLMGLGLRLASLRSFGVPYLSSLPLAGLGSAEDSILRPPYRVMRPFGRFLAGRRGRR